MMTRTQEEMINYILAYTQTLWTIFVCSLQPTWTRIFVHSERSGRRCTHGGPGIKSILWASQPSHIRMETLCGWNFDFQQLLNLLISFHPSLQLSLEVCGSAINFLDLTISLHPHDPPHLTLSFSIFCKPTNSGFTIHGSSLYTSSRKLTRVDSKDRYRINPFKVMLMLDRGFQK